MSGIQNLWRRCFKWMQNSCNDYENCGAYEKCKDALDRLGKQLINQHCLLSLERECDDDKHCGEYEKCKDALERIRGNERIAYSPEGLKLLGISV